MVNLFEQFSLLAVLFCLGCSSTCFTTAWHCSMATTSSWAWHCSSARQGIVHQHGIDPGHGNLEKILMKTSVTIRMQCHRLLCICHVVCCVVIIIFFIIISQLPLLVKLQPPLLPIASDVCVPEDNTISFSLEDASKIQNTTRDQDETMNTK